MNIEIREIPTRKAVCMAHVGPYYMIGEKFGHLWNWMQANGVQGGPAIGIYYDDPGTVPADQLRSDAGVIVPDDFATDDPSVHVVEVVGGTFAVGTFVGAYEGLGSAWNELCGQWFPKSGLELREALSFEIYVDDCSVTPPEKLRTELYIGVKQPAAV